MKSNVQRQAWPRRVWCPLCWRENDEPDAAAHCWVCRECRGTRDALRSLRETVNGLRLLPPPEPSAPPLSNVYPEG